MTTPATKAPAYRKYVLNWEERPGAGPSEYEAAQTRILNVFRQWDTPAGLTFHQFVVKVGAWGGYAVIETSHAAASAFPGGPGGSGTSGSTSSSPSGPAASGGSWS